jgi:hypothetical protein
MREFVGIVCAILAFLVCGPTASAWSFAGHQVIAAGAWRELPPNTKTTVTELLKAHPDYAKWESSFPGNSSNLDLPAFIFMRASSWADEIRRRGNAYDHPHWHYVDYPLKPRSFPLEAAPEPDDDALYGISHCEKILRDTKASLQERAVYLAWLIHLIGDLHQPLHCSSLVTGTYPAGDKGGNDFYVKPGSKGIKLHALWDGLLGTSGKPQSRLNYAIQIQAEHPRNSLPELKKSKTVKEWSLEGRSLAIEKAYLHGELKGSISADDAPTLPEGYTKAAKGVAEKQAALAGYRLADTIRACLQ